MMPPVNPFLFSFALAVAAFLFFRRHRRPTRPLPPGPKKLPLVGNILQIFDGFDSESCARWGEKYRTYLLCPLRVLLEVMRRFRHHPSQDTGVFNDHP